MEWSFISSEDDTTWGSWLQGDNIPTFLVNGKRVRHSFGEDSDRDWEAFELNNSNTLEIPCVNKRLGMNLPENPSHYRKKTSFGVVSYMYPTNGSFFNKLPGGGVSVVGT